MLPKELVYVVCRRFTMLERFKQLPCLFLSLYDVVRTCSAFENVQGQKKGSM